MNYGNGGADQDGGWDSFCRDTMGRPDEPCCVDGRAEERDYDSGNSYTVICDCAKGQRHRIELERGYYETREGR